MKSRVLLSLLVASALNMDAARITVVPKDGPGEGFNDPTPVAPVGGNSGTTIGQQRLIAFQHAADLWGALIESNVEIIIRAKFDPLECNATSGVLGQAGPLQAAADFPGAIPGTWYPVPLANALSNRDQDPGTPGVSGDDIQATFSTSLDRTDCLGGNGWYYGLDANHGSQSDLVTVVMHEIGHGLGFLSFVNSQSGEFLGAPSNAKPDVYSRNLADAVTGKTWPQLSAAERVASSTSGNLVWNGPRVTAAAPARLGTPRIRIDSPPSIAGTYGTQSAEFGPRLPIEPLQGTLVLMRDAATTEGPLETDGCSTLLNAQAIAGKIAVVDRGTCTFVAKALNAQAAGAIALIVVNNVSGTAQGMAGNDPTVRIPVVSLSIDDGARIKPLLDAGVTATLQMDTSVLSGTDASGRVRLYSPNPFDAGSSVSHFDRSATPNLLMEPVISSDLKHVPDLTIDLFQDIGWQRADSSPRLTAKMSASITDTNGDGRLNPGEEIRYGVSIRNDGGTARGVIVRDILSQHLMPSTTRVATTTGTATVDIRNVTIAIGTLDPGATVEMTISSVLDPLTPPSVTSILNQVSIAADGTAGFVSDDPATAAENDATGTSIRHVLGLRLRASMRAESARDDDGDGRYDRGEHVRFVLTLSNGGATSKKVRVTNLLPESLSLVDGSLQSSKGVAAARDGSIDALLGDLAPGAEVTLTFDAAIAAGTSATQIANQATITARGVPAVFSDDPAQPGKRDATIVPLDPPADEPAETTTEEQTEQ